VKETLGRKNKKKALIVTQSTKTKSAVPETVSGLDRRAVPLTGDFHDRTSSEFSFDRISGQKMFTVSDDDA
jgi:hypothetical protein